MKEDVRIVWSKCAVSYSYFVKINGVSGFIVQLTSQ